MVEFIMIPIITVILILLAFRFITEECKVVKFVCKFVEERYLVIQSKRKIDK